MVAGMTRLTEVAVWEVVCATSIGARNVWRSSRRISTSKINVFQLAAKEKSTTLERKKKSKWVFIYPVEESLMLFEGLWIQRS